MDYFAFQIVLLAIAASAIARPDSGYSAPQKSAEVIEILRDDRVHPEDGSYSFDIETADGIQRSEAGQNQNDAGSVVQAGQVR